jgi:predicted nucleotide-binding protein
MAVRDLTFFFPTADKLLAADLPRLGEVLLLHLYSWKDQGKVWQPVGGLNRAYFVQVMEGREQGLGPPRRREPEYGAGQPEVTQRMQEAWNWLERQGHLMQTAGQPVLDWYVITSEGEKLVQRLNRYEHWEKLGLDRVKADLVQTGGIRDVGGPPEVREQAWEWVHMKEKRDVARGATANRPTELAELSRKVFIVHGHDDGAREAVARFLERVGLEPIILHEQANRGRTIIEKFEAHQDVGFAVVLLTPDDEGCEKGGTPLPRARQNVVLELGYFVGVLGRDHVCALRRGDVEIPSDMTGVVYVPFDNSDGWKQSLGRELEAAGFEIDWGKAMGVH